MGEIRLDDAIPPPVPQHLVPVLEQVLNGTTEERRAQEEFGLTDRELGILLRALIRRSCWEQWEFAD